MFLHVNEFPSVMIHRFSFIALDQDVDDALSILFPVQQFYFDDQNAISLLHGNILLLLVSSQNYFTFMPSNDVNFF